jgi:hypothetical protein
MGKDAAAQARADRREAERQARLKTGKAVKIPPPKSNAKKN